MEEGLAATAAAGEAEVSISTAREAEAGSVPTEGLTLSMSTEHPGEGVTLVISSEYTCSASLASGVWLRLRWEQSLAFLTSLQRTE